MRKVTKSYKNVGGKNVLVSKTVTGTKMPRFLNANQRTKLNLAKLNQSTAKSAISEIGRTVRDVGAQIAATQGYKTYTASQGVKRLAESNNVSIDNALKLYNQVVNGNPDQQGESGDNSTTLVGGSGSAIGG